MAGAERAFALMARSGPEDTLTIVRLGPSTEATGLHTAPPLSALSMSKDAAKLASFDSKDPEEATAHLARWNSTGPVGAILRDAAVRRRHCTKQFYNMELCTRTKLAHQVRDCDEAGVPLQMCGVKFSRAVDTLCRKPLWNYVECAQKAGLGAPGTLRDPKCYDAFVAFDQCMEAF